MNSNKKAFTFVELIITLWIIVLLWVIAVTTLNKSNENVNNTKIESDTITLKNALIAYKQTENKLPKPSWNNNYFAVDSTYSHSTSTGAFWVYGSVTEDTIPKKYIDAIPLDPISNHYYSYWKTLDSEFFEIASVIRKWETASTKLDWTYPWEYWPISLIREYNWAFFISDRSTNHLPYNPDDHILSAKIWSYSWTVKVNGTLITGNISLVEWDDIETGTESYVNIFFSDWSVSTLKADSKLTLSSLKYKSTENNLLTQIKLFLWTWEIFTKATSLNSDGSDFEVYTSDTSAAVRWTIFSVSTNPWSTQVLVFEWEVKAYQAHNEKTRKLNLPNNWWTIINWWNQAYISEWADLQNSVEPIYDTEVIINELDQTKEIISENLPEWKSLEAILRGYDEVAVVDTDEETWTPTTPTTNDCDWTPDWIKKDFYEIWNVEYWQTCPNSIEFICDNWIWKDASWNAKDPIYEYTSCSIWTANNCNETTKTIWTHTYNIPAITNNSNSTSYILIDENHWEFQYSLFAECDNWTLSYETEEWPILMNCNTWYTESWDQCIIAYAQTIDCEIWDLTWWKQTLTDPINWDYWPCIIDITNKQTINDINWEITIDVKFKEYTTQIEYIISDLNGNKIKIWYDSNDNKYYIDNIWNISDLEINKAYSFTFQASSETYIWTFKNIWWDLEFMDIIDYFKITK